MAGRPKKLKDTKPSDLASVAYYEETKLGGMECFFITIKHPAQTTRTLTLMILGVDFFSVDVKSYEEMVEARRAIARIKFGK